MCGMSSDSVDISETDETFEDITERETSEGKLGGQ